MNRPCASTLGEVGLGPTLYSSKDSTQLVSGGPGALPAWGLGSLDLPRVRAPKSVVPPEVPCGFRMTQTVCCLVFVNLT